MWKYLSICVALLLCLGLLYGQGERGALNGTVTDSTGAVVPQAKVTATHVETNTVYTAVTTEAGIYRLPYLPIGTYKISFSVPGFRTSVAENIVLRVAQTLTVDSVLEVGQVTEQVTVTGQTPPIETGSAEIGRYVSRREFVEMPIMIEDGKRQLTRFVFDTLPGTVGSIWAGSINGSQTFSHEILIEGMSIGRIDLQGGSNSEFSPASDSVSEVKLQTGVMGAQYGGGQTAVVNFALKSGTNELHGTAYDFLQNEALRANGFSNNAVGIPKSGYKETSLGGAVGGPVFLPKVYDGRNKTFFFVNYEHMRYVSSNTLNFATLPTAAFKRGDFSRLLDPAYTGNSKSGTVVGTDALGRSVAFGQIYDPRSTRTVNGTAVRDPFLGNIIPQSQWSSISSTIVGMNLISDPAIDRLFENQPKYQGSPLPFTENILSLKGDQHFGSNHRLSAFVNYNKRYRPSCAWGQPPGKSAEGDAGINNCSHQEVPGRMVRLAEDWIISPTIINHFGVGYNRFGVWTLSPSVDGNWPSKIGLQNVPQTTFPQMNFGGPSLFGGGLGDGGIMGYASKGFTVNGSTIFQDDLTIIRGKHSFRTGFEARFYYVNGRNFSSTPSFNFSSLETQLPGFNASTGHAFASWLLGAVDSTSSSVITTTPGYRLREPTFYFADDWRVNNKLTLSLGIRWQIVGGFYEVAGRMANIDLNKPNPGAGGFPGALVWADDLKRKTFQDTNWKMLAPRLGFAYAFSPKFVLRGGYGINSSEPVTAWRTPSTIGYNGSISLNAGNTPLAFPQDPVLYWDQPYPSFTGTLPNKNPAMANGQGFRLVTPNANRLGYLQNYNLGFQRALPANFVLEASYIGSRGVRLRSNGLDELNQVPVSALQLGDALIQPLSKNPQLAPLPYAGFNGTLAQALRRFPQYQGVNLFMPNFGSTWYNSLQLMARRNFTNGLSVLAAYTFSKLLTNVESPLESVAMQDVANRGLEKSVASYNMPQDFKLTWIYALPIGAGQRVDLGRLGNAIVGGWVMTAIQRYRSGDALGIRSSGARGDAIFNGSFRPDVVLDVPQVKESGPFNYGRGTRQYLNPAAFVQVPRTGNGVPIRLGNAPRYLPNVRGPAWYSENFGIHKRFLFTEQVYLEVRADTENVFNRAGPGNPVTDLTSPLFGTITGIQGYPIRPRMVQIEMRLNF